jgi:hypothetical protein
MLAIVLHISFESQGLMLVAIFVVVASHFHKYAKPIIGDVRGCLSSRMGYVGALHEKI